MGTISEITPLLGLNRSAEGGLDVACCLQSLARLEGTGLVLSEWQRNLLDHKDETAVAGYRSS